jgi:tetratricopeptide (TPR) repeat protein
MMTGTRVRLARAVRMGFVALAPLAAFSLAAAFAPLARAEEIRLVSGTRYQASDVEVRPGTTPGTGDVKFTVYAGTGHATLSLPFDRIDPGSLFDLVLLRTKPGDPAGQLFLARFALSRGMLLEAENCFKKAAALEPTDATLAADRDAGLASIAAARAEQALVAAEKDLKRGRGDLAIEKARDVAAKAPPGSSIAARAAAIVDLASRVVDRDRRRAEAEDAARSEAAAAAHKAAFDATLLRIDVAVNAGLKERDRVADPNLGASAATNALESAAARFREGRRLITAAIPTAGTRLSELTGRDKDVLGFLVTTDLDLADLYRQDRRFDRARDYLRASQALDPTNPRIKELRDLVEQDLHTPVAPPPQDYYEPTVLDAYYGGYYPYGSTVISGSGCRPYCGSSLGYGHSSCGRGCGGSSVWAHGSWGNVHWAFHW